MVAGASFARGRSFSWTQARHRIDFALGGPVSASIFGPHAVMSDEPYDPLRRSWDLGPPPVKSYPPFEPAGE